MTGLAAPHREDEQASSPTLTVAGALERRPTGASPPARFRPSPLQSRVRRERVGALSQTRPSRPSSQETTTPPAAAQRLRRRKAIAAIDARIDSRKSQPGPLSQRPDAGTTHPAGQATRVQSPFVARA